MHKKMNRRAVPPTAATLAIIALFNELEEVGAGERAGGEGTARTKTTFCVCVNIVQFNLHKLSDKSVWLRRGMEVLGGCGIVMLCWVGIEQVEATSVGCGVEEEDDSTLIVGGHEKTAANFNQQILIHLPL